MVIFILKYVGLVFYVTNRTNYQIEIWSDKRERKEGEGDVKRYACSRSNISKNVFFERKRDHYARLAGEDPAESEQECNKGGVDEGLWDDLKNVERFEIHLKNEGW